MSTQRSDRGPKGRKRLATVLRATGRMVRVDEAAAALEINQREAAKLLSRWVSQGYLKRLRRGLYAPVGLDSLGTEATLPNPLILVPQLFSPGYVGGWSAAEHWDLTEQIFRDICVFTARPVRSKKQKADGITFVAHKLAESRIFGTKPLWEGRVRIPISDPHRTLLDMLWRPAVGGGLRHIQACLASYLASDGADLEKLIAYGDTLSSGTVFKRLGFLLEHAASRKDHKPVIEACRQRLTKGHSRLDPALPADRLVTRWRLWVPDRWRDVERD